MTPMAHEQATDAQPTVADIFRRAQAIRRESPQTTYKEIKERTVWSVVKSWLSAIQQETLEELAPAAVRLALQQLHA